jgi:hypothetical protein
MVRNYYTCNSYHLWTEELRYQNPCYASDYQLLQTMQYCYKDASDTVDCWLDRGIGLGPYILVL